MELKKISDKNTVTRIGDVRLYIKQEEVNTFLRFENQGQLLDASEIITVPVLSNDIDYKSMGLLVILSSLYNTKTKKEHDKYVFEYLVNVGSLISEFKRFNSNIRKETIENIVNKLIGKLKQCEELVNLEEYDKCLRLTLVSKQYFSINENLIMSCLKSDKSSSKKISILGILGQICKYSIYEKNSDIFYGKAICLAKQKDLCEYSSISTKQWKTLFHEMVKGGLLCFVKTYSPVYGTLKYYIADACSFDYLVWYLSYGKVAITSNIYIREYYLNGVHLIDKKEDNDYDDVQEVA